MGLAAVAAQGGMRQGRLIQVYSQPRLARRTARRCRAPAL
jgi:hypothetical protein